MRLLWGRSVIFTSLWLLFLFLTLLSLRGLAWTANIQRNIFVSCCFASCGCFTRSGIQLQNWRSWATFEGTAATPTTAIGLFFCKFEELFYRFPNWISDLIGTTELLDVVDRICCGWVNGLVCWTRKIWPGCWRVYWSWGILFSFWFRNLNFLKLK